MASAVGITARGRTAWGAGALALLLATALAAAPSGCFLESTGLGAAGTTGSGGKPTSSSHSASGTSSSSVGSSGSAGSGGATTVSVSASASASSSASSSSGGCTSAAMCGTDGECNAWACTAGMCANQPTVPGMPCKAMPGACDSAGACVACVVVGTTQHGCAAATDYCYQATCASCSDNKTNGDETDMDCGGKNCPPCALGKTCAGPSDCASNGCTAGKCSTCNDGVKDGDETAVDCGGSCPPCADGKLCKGGGDCTSGNCVGFVCCDAPCAGSCQSCNLPSQVGTCTKIPDGSTAYTAYWGCTSTQVCDSMGACQTLAPKYQVGSPCNNNSECFNNNCVMTVCKLSAGDYCGAPGANTTCSSDICGVTHKCM